MITKLKNTLASINKEFIKNIIQNDVESDKFVENVSIFEDYQKMIVAIKIIDTISLQENDISIKKILTKIVDISSMLKFAKTDVLDDELIIITRCHEDDYIEKFKSIYEKYK